MVNVDLQSYTVAVKSAGNAEYAAALLAILPAIEALKVSGDLETDADALIADITADAAVITARATNSAWLASVRAALPQVWPNVETDGRP